jgi:beta-glucosidase/6-phospho-beta-glucosidase/beta-galactosidase
MSPLGSIFAPGTKCPLCTCTYSNPKVLQCFHTFCETCLEKVQDKVTSAKFFNFLNNMKVMT